MEKEEIIEPIVDPKVIESVPEEVEKYLWALNPLKLQRAIANVHSKVGPKYTEEDVKKLYVEYGGLLSE